MTEFRRNRRDHYARDRRNPSPGLLRALAVIEGMERRQWDESDADSLSAATARAFNSALWDARCALMKEIQEGEPTLNIVQPKCTCQQVPSASPLWCPVHDPARIAQQGHLGGCSTESDYPCDCGYAAGPTPTEPEQR